MADASIGELALKNRALKKADWFKPKIKVRGQPEEEIRLAQPVSNGFNPKIATAKRSVPSPSKDYQQVTGVFLDRLNDEDLKKAKQARPEGNADFEKKMGLDDSTRKLTGKPKNWKDELDAGVDEGSMRIGQMAAGLSSLMPGKFGNDAEKRRVLYKDRADIDNAFRNRGAPKKAWNSFSPGDVATTTIQHVPDVLNPVNKAGAAAKVANGLWHGVRGYTSNKDVGEALSSAAGSVIGEKADDLVTHGKGIVGNAAGALAEAGLDKLRSMIPQQQSAPSTQPNEDSGTEDNNRKRIAIIR